MWRLTDARLNSSEAATVIAVLCEHLLAKSLESMVPLGARDPSLARDPRQGVTPISTRGLPPLHSAEPTHPPCG